MSSLPLTAGSPPATCAVEVAAWAVITARLSEIPSLRDGGWPEAAPGLPRRFLRHADEQTVVGMHAVLAAIGSLPEPRSARDGHGVIAASCQAGRIPGAQTLVQAKRGGGVTVSTHIVPQGSLHSLAGAVSVGLGMHGPNIGVSGGPEALAEGLLTAFSWLRAPGPHPCALAWLLVTEWDDEPALDLDGMPTTDPVCRAAALALARSAAADGQSLGRLLLRLDPCCTDAHAPDATRDSLRSLCDALTETSRTGLPPRWSSRLPWGMGVCLTMATTAALREAA